MHDYDILVINSQLLKSKRTSTMHCFFTCTHTSLPLHTMVEDHLLDALSFDDCISFWLIENQLSGISKFNSIIQ